MKLSAAAFLTATMATSGIAEETLNAGDGCLQGEVRRPGAVERNPALQILSEQPSNPPRRY